MLPLSLCLCIVSMVITCFCNFPLDKLVTSNNIAGELVINFWTTILLTLIILDVLRIIQKHDPRWGAIISSLCID